MTVYARGIDYAWQHPDPKAIKDAGYDFVCRYYSRDPSKNLTRAEADALAVAGLWIVGNWEHTAQDALGGTAAGIANANLARSLATACGQPATRPIYESDDWDVTPAQEATVTAYLRSWDSVIGVAQVGEYGGYYPLRAQRDAGVTSWEWQTRAWSGGQWDQRVNIRQVGAAVIGGVQVDTNEALTDDYGQWQPGRSPSTPTPLETPVTHLISVTPDPTGGPAAGLFLVDGGRVSHVTSGTYAEELEAKFGQPLTATVADYQAHLAAMGSLTVDAAALGAAIAAGLKFPTEFTGTLSSG